MKVLCILALLVCYVTADTIVGGWETVETDDEDVVAVSRYAAKQVSDRTNSPYHHRLVDILSARRQVVSGMNYEVKFELRETVCKKTEHTFEEADQCEDNDATTPTYCTVQVRLRSWENLFEVVDFHCSRRP